MKLLTKNHSQSKHVSKSFGATECVGNSLTNSWQGFNSSIKILICSINEAHELPESNVP